MVKMLVVVLLLCWLSSTSSSYFPYEDDESVREMLSEPLEIVGFYNLYADGEHFQQIVQEQTNTIQTSGLLERVSRIYYTTMGRKGESFKINHEKYQKIMHYGDEGEEVQTYSLLYKFCHNNPSSKVFYFHDKGSYHLTYENVKFRKYLDCYVLNTNCIDALENHDTCGWRISPTPHVHYSGNFWWARCDYINTLIDPLSPLTNQTFIALTETLNGCVGAHGRYFAETWIGSGPKLYPADCMNASVDTSFVWGYKFPAAADSYCHGQYAKSGLPCQTASTYQEPHKFAHAITEMASYAKGPCRDTESEFVKRSYYWYGREPSTYLDWINRLSHADYTAEGTILRFSDSKQLYYMFNGELRPFEKSEPFFAMGLDFDDAKATLSINRRAYKFGAPVPPNGLDLGKKDQENNTIRFEGEKEIYLARKGKLHAFPDFETFEAMGFSYKEILPETAARKPLYQFGPMLNNN